MVKTGYNETYDKDGNLLSSTPVQIPEKVVSPAMVATAKQQLKGFVGTYFNPATGQPQGTLNLTDARNWLLSLTVMIRDITQEMDNEP